MTELLALPAREVSATPLSAWADALTGLGLSVAVRRESADASWLEVEALGVRGYAVTEGRNVEAINFELDAPDPGPAREALGRAAAALSWELHEDDGEDED